jgi:hypothetical protein
MPLADAGCTGPRTRIPARGPSFIARIAILATVQGRDDTATTSRGRVAPAVAMGLFVTRPISHVTVAGHRRKLIAREIFIRADTTPSSLHCACQRAFTRPGAQALL